MESIVKASGIITLSLENENGEKYFEMVNKNLVVQTGRNYIASRMKSAGIPAEIGWMELGTSSTAPNENQQALVTPFTPTIARVPIQVSGGTVSNNKITYVATFPAGVATGNITEAGLFNASTGGIMLCRTVFGVVNKPASDSLSITWEVTISV
jgi:hypothetical protein